MPGKKIKNPISYVITLTDGTYRVRADYGVVCEHDIENRRSMEISLLPATLHDIHEEAIGQIHALEGTTELVTDEPEEDPVIEPEP